MVLPSSPGKYANLTFEFTVLFFSWEMSFRASSWDCWQGSGHRWHMLCLWGLSEAPQGTFPTSRSLPYSLPSLPAEAAPMGETNLGVLSWLLGGVRRVLSLLWVLGGAGSSGTAVLGCSSASRDGAHGALMGCDLSDAAGGSSQPGWMCRAEGNPRCSGWQ